MNGYWRDDLDAWLARFLATLRHKTRARMCPAYIAGLIGPGDRKRIQRMAARAEDVSYGQPHHFVASGVWDSAPLEGALLAEADAQVGGNDAWLIIDDTYLPKKGMHSLGVGPSIRINIGQERQLLDSGVVDAGLSRSAGHGWLAAVSARKLDQRSNPA